MSECNCYAKDGHPRPSLEHGAQCPVKLEFYGGKAFWNQEKVYIKLNTETIPDRPVRQYWSIFVYVQDWSWMPLLFTQGDVADKLRQRYIEVVE